MKAIKYSLLGLLLNACIVVQAQTDILDARINYSVGQVVTVTGIVTSGADLGSVRYLQDATAGIALYLGSTGFLDFRAILEMKFLLLVS